MAVASFPLPAARDALCQYRTDQLHTLTREHQDAWLVLRQGCREADRAIGKSATPERFQETPASCSPVLTCHNSPISKVVFCWAVIAVTAPPAHKAILLQWRKIRMNFTMSWECWVGSDPRRGQLFVVHGTEGERSSKGSCILLDTAVANLKWMGWGDYTAFLISRDCPI